MVVSVFVTIAVHFELVQPSFDITVLSDINNFFYWSTLLFGIVLVFKRSRFWTLLGITAAAKASLFLPSTNVDSLIVSQSNLTNCVSYNDTMNKCLAFWNTGVNVRIAADKSYRFKFEGGKDFFLNIDSVQLEYTLDTGFYIGSTRMSAVFQCQCPNTALSFFSPTTSVDVTCGTVSGDAGYAVRDYAKIDYYTVNNITNPQYIPGAVSYMLDFVSRVEGCSSSNVISGCAFIRNDVKAAYRVHKILGVKWKILAGLVFSNETKMYPLEFTNAASTHYMGNIMIKFPGFALPSDVPTDGFLASPISSPNDLRYFTTSDCNDYGQHDPTRFGFIQMRETEMRASVATMRSLTKIESIHCPSNQAEISFNRPTPSDLFERQKSFLSYVGGSGSMIYKDEMWMGRIDLRNSRERLSASTVDMLTPATFYVCNPWMSSTACSFDNAYMFTPESWLVGRYPVTTAGFTKISAPFSKESSPGCFKCSSGGVLGWCFVGSVFTNDISDDPSYSRTSIGGKLAKACTINTSFAAYDGQIRFMAYSSSATGTMTVVNSFQVNSTLGLVQNVLINEQGIYVTTGGMECQVTVPRNLDVDVTMYMLTNSSIYSQTTNNGDITICDIAYSVNLNTLKVSAKSTVAGDLVGFYYNKTVVSSLKKEVLGLDCKEFNIVLEKLIDNQTVAITLSNGYTSDTRTFSYSTTISPWSGTTVDTLWGGTVGKISKPVLDWFKDLWSRTPFPYMPEWVQYIVYAGVGVVLALIMAMVVGMLIYFAPFIFMFMKGCVLCGNCCKKAKKKIKKAVKKVGKTVKKAVKGKKVRTKEDKVLRKQQKFIEKMNKVVKKTKK